MDKQYAKLVNDNLEFAPNAIELSDGTWVVPPGESLLREEGFKEVTYTDPPESKENYVLNSSFVEEDDKIVQVWEEEYIEPEYTIEERVAVLEEMFMEMMEE